MKTGLILWKQHLDSVSKVLMLWGEGKSSLFQIVDDSSETAVVQLSKKRKKCLPNRRYNLVGVN